MMEPKISSEMDSGASDHDNEIRLKNHLKYRIAAYNTWGDEAFKEGDLETAEELYNKAIEEIEEYRKNISDIRDQATLDQEDRHNLEELEQNLDHLEQGIEEQLSLLH